MLTEAEQRAIAKLESLVAHWDAQPFAAIAYDADIYRCVIRDCLRLAQGLRDRLTDKGD